MPTAEEQNKSRLARSTTQVGLPSLVIAMLAAFDVIDWNTEQTSAVVAFATFVLAGLMNYTQKGREVLAP